MRVASRTEPTVNDAESGAEGGTKAGMHPPTHGMIGWLTGCALEHRRDRILVTAAALLPDIDGLLILGGEALYGRWHHTFGHNLFAGLALAAGAAVVARQRTKAAVLVLVSFHGHLLCDLLGSGTGWGIPWLWPLVAHEWMLEPPFQWELVSWQNILTTVVCMMAIAVVGARHGRTIVEVVSVRADAAVVEVVQRRLSWVRARR